MMSPTKEEGANLNPDTKLLVCLTSPPCRVCRAVLLLSVLLLLNIFIILVIIVLEEIPRVPEPNLVVVGYAANPRLVT